MASASRALDGCLLLLVCSVWAAGARVADAGAIDVVALLQSRATSGQDEPLQLAGADDRADSEEEKPNRQPKPAKDAAEKKHADRERDTKALAKGPNVLVFMAVGSTYKTRERTIANIKKLKSSSINATVFLAHYDHHKQKWVSQGEQWYASNVDFSAELDGYKFQIARQVLPEHLAAHKGYDWVWLLDEDVDFTSTDVAKLFDLASRSQVLLAQPALYVPPMSAAAKAQIAKAAAAQASARARMARPPPAEANGSRPLAAKGAAPAMSALQLERRVGTRCQLWEAMCQHVAPHPACLYRYSNIVEVMAPLIRPQALLKLFKDCKHCIQEKSVWGLDLVWCNWLAKQFGQNKSTTCAIVDKVTIRHDNQKTLGKWDARGNRNLEVINRDYWGAWRSARSHYPDEFIGDYGHTLKCVSA